MHKCLYYLMACVLLALITDSAMACLARGPARYSLSPPSSSSTPLPKNVNADTLAEVPPLSIWYQWTSVLTEAHWSTLEEQSHLIHGFFDEPLVTATLGSVLMPGNLGANSPFNADGTARPRATPRTPSLQCVYAFTTISEATRNQSGDSTVNWLDLDSVASPSIISPYRHYITGKSVELLHPSYVDGRRRFSLGPTRIHDSVEEMADDRGGSHAGNTISETVLITSKKEYVRVKLTIQGEGHAIIRFDALQGHTVNTMMQLKDHRYAPTVPEDNCEGIHLTVQLRTDRSASVEGSLRPSGAVKAARVTSARRSAVSAFWYSFVLMLETSAFCEFLPSLSMRVDEVEASRPYYIVIQSRADKFTSSSMYTPTDLPNNSHTCAMEVFVSQTPVRELRRDQLIYSLLLPLLVVVVPLPFFLRRVDVMERIRIDVMLGAWIWAPPYYLRDTIADGLISVCKYVYESLRPDPLSCCTESLRRGGQRSAGPEKVRRRGRSIDNVRHTAAKRGFVKHSEQVRTILYTVTDLQGRARALYEILSRRWGLRCLSERAERECGESEAAEQATHVPEGSEGGPTHHQPGEPTESSPTTRSVSTREEAEAEARLGCVSCADERGRAPCRTKSVSHGDNDSADDANGEERWCRICRDGEECGPLVAPCSCTGSVRWVHRSCLDHWRMERVKRNLTRLSVCEICARPFTVSIQPRTLLWHCSYDLFRLLLLLATCATCLHMITLVSFRVVGELSCSAPYHRVAYTSIHRLDGLFLGAYVYCMVVVVMLFAHLVVYSWFHSRADVQAYVVRMHDAPPFVTRYNIALVMAVGLVLLAQAFASGFLLKLFIHATSHTAWNWETSSVVGGILFMIFIPIAQEVSKAIRSSMLGSGEVDGSSDASNDGTSSTTSSDYSIGNGDFTEAGSEEEEDENGEETVRDEAWRQGRFIIALRYVWLGLGDAFREASGEIEEPGATRTEGRAARQHVRSSSRARVT